MTEMIKILRNLGLSVIEAGELTGFVLSIIVIGVFMGNMVSVFVIKFYSFSAVMFDHFFDWIIKNIKGKLCK